MSNLPAAMHTIPFGMPIIGDEEREAVADAGQRATGELERGRRDVDAADLDALLRQPEQVGAGAGTHLERVQTGEVAVRSHGAQPVGHVADDRLDRRRVVRVPGDLLGERRLPGLAHLKVARCHMAAQASGGYPSYSGLP